VEDLARGYANLEKRFGTPPDQLVTLPKGPEDKEGLAAVMKALGAPDTPDGYKFEIPEGIAPEDATAASEFAKAMHAAGPFPPAFVAQAVNWWTSQVAARQEAELATAQQMTAAAETALKQEWGAAYETRKAEVGKLLMDLGGQGLADELNASAWGDNPKLAIALGKMVERLAEPGPNRDGARGGDPNVMTPAQATARAREMEAHPAFRDASHAMHRQIVEQRNAALRMASGMDPVQR